MYAHQAKCTEEFSFIVTKALVIFQYSASFYLSFSPSPILIKGIWSFFATLITKFFHTHIDTDHRHILLWPLNFFLRRLIMRFITTLLSTVCLFELDTDEWKKKYPFGYENPFNLNDTHFLVESWDTSERRTKLNQKRWKWEQKRLSKELIKLWVLLLLFLIRFHSFFSSL